MESAVGKDEKKGTSKSDSERECSTCHEEVLNNGVECEVCDSWFHCKCVGVATGTYMALQQDKSLHWYCQGCSKGVVSTWKKLQERQEQIEKEMIQLKVEFKELREGLDKIGKLETEVGKCKTECSAIDRKIKQMEAVEKESKMKSEQMLEKERQGIKQSFAQIVKEQEEERGKDLRTNDKDIQQKMIEMLEREKRRENIIIRGIKVSTEIEERKAVETILEELIPEMEIKYEIMGRVGRQEQSIARPLRVHIQDSEQRRRILNRGKQLKAADDDMLKRIYLAPDLTRMQQEEDKKLRDKLKRTQKQWCKRHKDQ
jgi:hypothetical protein